jgi:hypothetical protein
MKTVIQPKDHKQYIKHLTAGIANCNLNANYMNILQKM